MEKLYGNVGRLIKIIAFVSFILASVCSIGKGLFVLLEVSSTVAELSESARIAAQLSGLKQIILYPILFFLASTTMYGFGELVEKVCSIEKIQRDTYGENDDYEDEDSETFASRKYESAEEKAVELAIFANKLKKYSTEELEDLLENN